MDWPAWIGAIAAAVSAAAAGLTAWLAWQEHRGRRGPRRRRRLGPRRRAAPRGQAGRGNPKPASGYARAPPGRGPRRRRRARRRCPLSAILPSRKSACCWPRPGAGTAGDVPASEQLPHQAGRENRQGCSGSWAAAPTGRAPRARAAPQRSRRRCVDGGQLRQGAPGSWAGAATTTSQIARRRRPTSTAAKSPPPAPVYGKPGNALARRPTGLRARPRPGGVRQPERHLGLPAHGYQRPAARAAAAAARGRAGGRGDGGPPPGRGRPGRLVWAAAVRLAGRPGSPGVLVGCLRACGAARDRVC